MCFYFRTYSTGPFNYDYGMLRRKPFFAEDVEITDLSERFFVGEIVGKKSMNLLKMKLYQNNALFLKFKQKSSLLKILKSKKIGSEARKTGRKFVGQKCFWKLFVKKVRPKWRENETFSQRIRIQ